VRDKISLYKQAQDVSNGGYVYCKILYAKDKLPYDATIIDYNEWIKHLFESKQIVETKLIQVLLNIKSLSTEWIDTFKTSLINKQIISTDYFSNTLNQWLHIHVSYLNTNYLIIYVNPIPKSFAPFNKQDILNTILISTNELLINPDYDDALSKSIEMVGNVFKFDRICICKNNIDVNQDDELFNRLFEWDLNQTSKFNFNNRRGFNELIDILRKEKQYSYVVNKETEGILTEYLLQSEIKSILILPIAIKDEIWGFIGFFDYYRERIWLENEINLMQLFTNSIAKTIERKVNEKEIEHLSFRDSLTGLYNRRFFEFEFKHLDFEENLPISIIIADVNGLKLINDAFGHARGDLILKAASDVIVSQCRNSDIVARWGGDEFVILLPQTKAEEAKQIVKNINEKAAEVYLDSIPISISLASDTKDYIETDLNKTLKQAEDLMYKEKLMKSSNIKKNTINTIIQALFEKTSAEEQHAKRVSEICTQIGHAMNFDEFGIRYLKTIGLYHDIGKIAISKEILNKKEKLSEEEYKELKRHCEIGYRILSSSNDMSEIADIILNHHEKLDGTGYPNGLSEDKIPLMTKILSVAEAYDEMHIGFYGEPIAKKEIIKQLIENSCSQYDHIVVRTFVEKVLKQPWYSVLYGVNNTVIKFGAYFDPYKGIFVLDKLDANLSIDRVKITGNVNTSKTGNYSIIYSITNGLGQTERVLRKITVGKLIHTDKIKYQGNRWRKIEIEGAQFTYALKHKDLSVKVDKGGSNTWSAQLVYPGINIEKGKEYVISFEAKTDHVIKEIHVNMGWTDADNNYWHSFLNTLENKFYLTELSQTYQLIFKMEEETHPNSELKFEFGTNEDIHLSFTNIQISELIS